jgi:hypothetical protein
MTTATLNFLKTKKISKAKIISINFPTVNWKLICATSLLLCLCLLVYYVWQINYLTKGSYLIGSYQQQINRLNNEKKDLEVSFARASLLGQVQERVQALSFQNATSIKYIQVLENSFAAAKK